MTGSLAIIEVTGKIFELRLIFEESWNYFLDDFGLMELIRVLGHHFLNTDMKVFGEVSHSLVFLFVFMPFISLHSSP